MPHALPVGGACRARCVQAELLSRQGYDTWNWGDQALRRAGDLPLRPGPPHRRRGLERARSGHAWIPWLLNARYGTSFPHAQPGRARQGHGLHGLDRGGARSGTTPGCARRAAR